MIASFKSFVEEFNNETGCYYYMFKIFNGARETLLLNGLKVKKKIFIKFGIIYLIEKL